MASEAKKFATYEDLLKVPDHLIAEIIAGELITSPRPGPRHVHAASSLGGDIVNPFPLKDRGTLIQPPSLKQQGEGGLNQQGRTPAQSARDAESSFLMKSIC